MKIKVSNLGPLHGPVEFDLKPLTILIGPNNAGKTWLAYTLGSIFSAYGMEAYIDDKNLENVIKSYPQLSNTIEKLLSTGTAKINLVEFADEHGETYFNNIALHVREWLSSFMSTHYTSFSELAVSISLTDMKKPLLDRVLADSFHFGVGVSKSNMLINASKKRCQKDAYIYTTSNDPLVEDLPREIIERVLARELLRALHHSLYSDVVTLPTERTTLITLPLTQLAYISKEEEYKQSPSVNISPFSWPIAQYILSVIAAFDIGSPEREKREKKADDIPEIKEYSLLAHLLEQKILGGKVDFSHPEPGPMREIVFQPIGGSALEISVASSMVKELTSLVFYLRYFAQPGELLIIDEPEMNLHPKAQVQILEFLAMLVNTGLHVLITTHSPYITDHLLSLTKADEHTDKEGISAKFLLQDKRAFISKEQVSFYSVDQGKVVDAMDENSDWNTFGKVSDLISDIYFSL